MILLTVHPRLRTDNLKGLGVTLTLQATLPEVRGGGSERGPAANFVQLASENSIAINCRAPYHAPAAVFSLLLI